MASNNGVKLIEAERIRQIVEEHFTVHHDDSHTEGELASAGACYALAAGSTHPLRTTSPQFWPWQPKDWKPTGDPIRDLTKAGALIVAEIDRLLRERGETGEGEVDVPVTLSAEAYATLIAQRDAAVEALTGCERELAHEKGVAARAEDDMEAARAESHELRLHSSRLVELLADAWWVEAAYALAKLKDLTKK